MTVFKWNVKRTRAALLLAEGKMTDKAIAREVGISPWSLGEWKKHPQFAECVRSMVEQASRAMRLKSLAAKENRVAALADRQERMQRVIEARAELYKDVSGGETGLLVRQVRFVKLYNSDRNTPPQNDDEAGGEMFSPQRQAIQVEEYAVDIALLKEMREHEKQIAQELGEWTERHELAGKGGKDLPSLVITVNGTLSTSAPGAGAADTGD